MLNKLFHLLIFTLFFYSGITVLCVTADKPPAEDSSVYYVPPEEFFALNLIFLRFDSKQKISKLWSYEFSTEKTEQIFNDELSVEKCSVSDNPAKIVCLFSTKSNLQTAQPTVRNIFFLGELQFSSQNTLFLKKKLTEPKDGFMDTYPVFSNTGRFLAFNKLNLNKYGEDGYNAGTWLVDFKDMKMKRLDTQIHRPNHTNIPLAFSPDDRFLALHSVPFKSGESTSEHGSTIIINIKTAKPYKTFKNAQLNSWSSTGKYVLFTEYDPELTRSELSIFDKDFSRKIVLTPDTLSDDSPDWAPLNDTYLAIHSRDKRGISKGVFIMNVETLERTLLDENGYSPKWLLFDKKESVERKYVVFIRQNETYGWIPEIWLAGSNDSKWYFKQLVSNGDSFFIVKQGKK